MKSSNDVAAEFCVLTPVGRGAVAVIGVRGESAAPAILSCFRPASSRLAARGELPDQRVTFGHWRSDAIARSTAAKEKAAVGEEVVRAGVGGGVIGEEVIGEDVIVLRRGDVLEINCHGGLASVSAIARDLERAGCREVSAAEWIAGETGGDLIRAEAWQALASATTERAAAILLDQMNGALRTEIAAIVGLLAATDQEQAAARLQSLAAVATLGRRLTSSWKIAVVGPPNVGKSSLINRIVGFERSIVHAEPGTTRDVVTSASAVDGWPVEFLDTAGMHASEDELEAEGIARGQVAAESADVIIRVGDARTLVLGSKEYARLLASDPADNGALARPQLLVANKIDLLETSGGGGSFAVMGRAAGREVIGTSALHGEGIESLVTAIGTALVPAPPPAGAAVPFTPRHVTLLQESLQAVNEDDPPTAILTLSRIVTERLPELPIPGWQG